MNTEENPQHSSFITLSFKRKVHLKCKILTLCAESRIIRHQEEKCRNNLYAHVTLNKHRKVVLRKEARNILLAYGFLNGKEYSQLETRANFEPDWSSIRRYVKKFGVGGEWSMGVAPPDIESAKNEQMEQFEAWADVGYNVFVHRLKSCPPKVRKVRTNEPLPVQPILMGRHIIAEGFAKEGHLCGNLCSLAYQAQLNNEFNDLTGAVLWCRKNIINPAPASKDSEICK